MSAYDVVVIGAGPGGYVAAIRAAQLGLKAAVVENRHLGGVCLNWGCIPTKALLRSAEVYRLAQHAEAYGLKTDGLAVDLPAIVSRSRRVSGQLNAGVTGLLRKNKVDVIWGRASIPRVGAVTVAPAREIEYGVANPKPKPALGPGEYLARHIIVATGARPRVLPGLEADGRLVWTYVEAMTPDVTPKSLLIVGSGAIGVEFASFYRAIGVDVTVVEMAAAGVAARRPRHRRARRGRASSTQGNLISCSERRWTALRKGANEIAATVDPGDGTHREIKVDRVISAVGVVGNIERLGLEALGVKTDRGCVVTDGLGRTNVPGIYAIGDVAGPPMLAHKAEHEGVPWSRPSRAKPVHPLDKRKIAGLHLFPSASGLGRPDGESGQKRRLRSQDRPLPFRRQRQGDRPRRAGGPGEDDLRRQDRPAPRRPHDRRRSDGIDSRIRRRDATRDHRRWS